MENVKKEKVSGTCHLSLPLGPIECFAVLSSTFR
jgi:hypothetical protein